MKTLTIYPPGEPPIKLQESDTCKWSITRSTYVCVTHTKFYPKGFITEVKTIHKYHNVPFIETTA